MAGRIFTALVIFQLLSMVPILESETIEGQIIVLVKFVGWLGTHYAIIWIPALIIMMNKKARRIFDKVTKKVLA